MVAKSPSSAALAGGSSRSSCRVWGIVIVLAVIVVFGRLAAADFVGWDDPFNLYENARLNPPTWSGIAHYWGHAAHGLYIPLTYTVWGALAALTNLEPDAQGISMNPWVFHGFNVLLHAAGALAAFAILARFFSCSPAAVGALVFALHPVQVESVGWAAGMKDVLAGFLALVALWQYIEAARASTPPANLHSAGDAAAQRDQPPLSATAHYAIALSAFVLAMLAKPSALVVPALALVADLWLVRRRLGTSLRALAPWFVLSLACAILARMAQDTSGMEGAPLWARPFIAGDALVFYLLKLIWPRHLAIDYGRFPAHVLEHGSIYIAWLVPTLIFGLLWLKRRRWPELFASMLIFVIAVSPVLGLSTFQFQYVSTVADHYLYLAMLGPALAAAWLAQRASLQFGRTAVISATAAVMVALGARSAVQAGVWCNNQRLFSNAVQVNERSFVGWNGLGMVALLDNELEKAEAHFRRATELNPEYAQAHGNLGNALELLGRYEEASYAQARALQLLLSRQDSDARQVSRLAAALAFNLARLERYDEAIAKLRLALEHKPDNPELLGWLEELEQRAARAASTRAAPTTTTPATNPP